MKKNKDLPQRNLKLQNYKDGKNNIPIKSETKKSISLHQKRKEERIVLDYPKHQKAHVMEDKIPSLLVGIAKNNYLHGVKVGKPL